MSVLLNLKREKRREIEEIYPQENSFVKTITKENQSPEIVEF